MQPFYNDERWETEKFFIEYINNLKKVNWWFQNGKQDAKYFAVPYEDGGKKPFYVDFIIKMNDGSIGLLDTKSGITIKDAKEKSDGLQSYIKSENKKNKKLFGGIVANTDSKKFTGRWMIYTGKGEHLRADSFNNWENLEI